MKPSLKQMHLQRSRSPGVNNDVSTGMRDLQCRRERNRLRSRRITATVVTALACMLFLAWLRLDNVALRYQVGEREAELSRLLSEQRAYQTEVARMASPARLRAAAEAAGMRTPEPGEMILVRGPAR